MKRAAIGVFLIVFLSLAYFWHARDWNTASRLMLTYSLIDRGSIKIDGLDDQTGDKAFYKGHFYSDKLPGYSFLAAATYAPIKAIFGMPTHPVNAKGFAYFPADYAITLATSGLLTAVLSGLIVVMACQLGCGSRVASMLGLAYGLGTPAFIYGGLAYGHQASAAALLGSFALLWMEGGKRIRLVGFFAGFLAAFASVIELQVGPVSAILGFYCFTRVVLKQRPPSTVIWFTIGAAIPTVFLGIYNTIAFDSPLKMGYFYHATQRFAEVHNAANPLGLGRPDWARFLDLTIKPARGLFWYAPITLLTLPGLVVLAIKRRYDVAIVSLGVIVAVFLVNLSYPEWSGGWSTGPRLLVPLLPFAILPVAGLLSLGKKGIVWLAAISTLLGAVVILMFAGVGGRIPDPQPVPPGAVDRLSQPLWDAVLPMWSGERLPGWAFDRRFSHTLAWWVAPGWVDGLSVGRQWVQFLPLVGFQLLATTLLMANSGPRRVTRPTTSPDPAAPAPTETPAPAKPAPG